MKPLQYLKPTPIRLKDHAQFDEDWLRDRVVEDPSILALGDLEVKEVERRHSKAGRLDLLLRDPETSKRYEVEIMLGTVDESHIIRTIEYWDIERKRYPQYDHCAVLVAENITSRFLNVIALFNSAIPLIAIQLNAFQVGENVVLNFTRVLDELVLGEDDDDDETVQPADRAYWETKGSRESVAIADECLEILREIDPGLSLNYNKHHIGLAKGGRANNFVVFRARRKFLRVEAKVNDKDSWRSRLEDAGFAVQQASKAHKRLIFLVKSEDVGQNQRLLRELFETSHREQQK